MTVPRITLTLLKLHDDAITDFDSALSDQALNDPGLTKHSLDEEHDFEAKLYVQDPTPRTPEWLEFVRSGFRNVSVSRITTNKAALILRVPYYNVPRHFAVTFGYGRFLLDPDKILRDFGLRAALNAIYETDDPQGLVAVPRIRHVDALTLDSNTLHTRRQSSRRTTFDMFGVDESRDLLGAITGQPANSEVWGGRIEGRDALRIQAQRDFHELGAICRRTWRCFGRDDYKARFSWIDNMRLVTDKGTISKLTEEVLSCLKEGNIHTLELSPPGVVDWDQVSGFQYSHPVPQRVSDLRLADYVSLLQAENKLAGLSLRHLRQVHRVRLVDHNGIATDEWPLFRCIDGQVDVEGETWLIVDGRFFHVAASYMAELDRFVSGISQWRGDLPNVADVPAAEDAHTEAAYNAHAASTSPDYLLLDKELVRVRSRTSPIEVCDILVKDKALVHVKRKARSSSLSHLFSQGAVSADLLLMSPEFRTKVRERLSAAQGSQGRTGFESLISRDGINPRQWEVVYAVIDRWGETPFGTRLPFFSKINLRLHAGSLQRMGYRVSYKAIEE